MDQDELRDMLACRVDYYNILRHLYFSGPKPRIIEALVNLVGCVDLDNAASDIVEGVELLKSADALIDEQSADLERIQVEFARVFLGPGTPPAPLYESRYRAPDSLLMQGVTIEKRKSYLDAGLASAGASHVPEDHLAVELEYLYFLAGEALRLRETGDQQVAIDVLQESRGFLQQCTEWVAKMVDNALANTNEPVIRGMALVTRGLLNEDLLFLIACCDR